MPYRVHLKTACELHIVIEKRQEGSSKVVARKHAVAEVESVNA
jgi:hypothetical protein